MARGKVCDFCLSEKKGFFARMDDVLGGYHICSNCREKLNKYNLPIRYDLFQRVVVNDPVMHEMIMNNYLEEHTVSECLSKYYPTGSMMLHKGEYLVSAAEATLYVNQSRIPTTMAKQGIIQITREDVLNIEDGEERVPVTGTLYETSAALYFMSEHFINVHRLNNMVIDNDDKNAIHILENHRPFTYHIPNADLFIIRHKFYHIIQLHKRKENGLIYLASENTMTLTPGIYNIPKNIKSGTYWLSSFDDNGLSITDAAGVERVFKDGQVELSDGSRIEAHGEYQLRINKHEDN